MIQSMPPSSTDALNALRALAEGDDEVSFDYGTAIRDLLICDDEIVIRDMIDSDECPHLTLDDIHAVRRLLDTIRDDEYAGREMLTTLALDYSLCPLHFIDYAICFDDDDAECAAIRTIHPSHDT